MRPAPLLALLFAGCVAPRGPYLRAHADATEELTLYEGFETALIMRATLVTPAFLEAFGRERARLLGPALQAPDPVLEELKRDQQGVFEVVFAADSGKPDGKRFAADESGWNLRLEADGVEQPLISVERVRRPTPMQRSLFPQLTIWAELYVARFERTVADPDRVALHVGSGYGHDSLVWLDPGA